MPKLIVSFLLIAALSTLLAAILVLSSLVLTHQLESSEILKTLLPFWVGDMAGVVVLGPLFTAVLIYLFPNNRVNLKGFSYTYTASYNGFLLKITINIILIIIAMLLAYLFDT